MIKQARSVKVESIGKVRSLMVGEREASWKTEKLGNQGIMA